MLHCYLNNNKKLEKELSFSPFERGFFYGDGLFESLVVIEGNVLNMEDHLQRIQEGSSALKIKSNYLNKSFLQEKVEELISLNNIKGLGRLNLWLSRESGGKYSPTSTQGNLLITLKNESPSNFSPATADFCDGVQLQHTPFSRFKTISALPYVLASLEKQQKNTDELILTDSSGNISECTANTIFWYANTTLFTPKLETGCIGGIARKKILQEAKRQNIKTEEVFAKKEVLFEAEAIFICNIFSYRFIKKLGNRNFSTQNKGLIKFLDDLHYYNLKKVKQKAF